MAKLDLEFRSLHLQARLLSCGPLSLMDKPFESVQDASNLAIWPNLNGQRNLLSFSVQCVQRIGEKSQVYNLFLLIQSS